MQLSSLDHGAAIVGALIAAGATVIFRPTPVVVSRRHLPVLIRQIDDFSTRPAAVIWEAAGRGVDRLRVHEPSTAMVADNSTWCRTISSPTSPSPCACHRRRTVAGPDWLTREPAGAGQ